MTSVHNSPPYSSTCQLRAPPARFPRSSLTRQQRSGKRDAKKPFAQASRASLSPPRLRQYGAMDLPVEPDSDEEERANPTALLVIRCRSCDQLQISASCRMQTSSSCHFTSCHEMQISCQMQISSSGHFASCDEMQISSFQFIFCDEMHIYPSYHFTSCDDM